MRKRVQKWIEPGLYPGVLETQPRRLIAGKRIELCVFRLREVHHAPVVAEVLVAQRGVTIEPQTFAHQAVEMTHQEIGRRLMDRLVEELNEVAEVERPPKMEGYALAAIFLPKKR